MDEKPEVIIKDLIDYLSKLDPNMPVYLDKDGWDSEMENVEDKISYLMYPITYSGGTYLLINN